MGKGCCSLLHCFANYKRGMSVLDTRWRQSLKFYSLELVMSQLQVELEFIGQLQWMACCDSPWWPQGGISHWVQVPGSHWVHSVLPGEPSYTRPRPGSTPEPADRGLGEGGHRSCSAHPQLDHSKNLSDTFGSSVSWCSREGWGLEPEGLDLAKSWLLKHSL